MKSLERRLQVGLSLSLLTLFAMLWFIGQKSMDDLTHEFVVSRLEHDVETLLSAIQLKPDRIHMVHERVAPIYQQPFSGHYFSVSVANNPIIYSRSLWDQSLKNPHLKPGERSIQITDGPDSQTLLLISMGFSKKGQSISISLAEDLTAIDIQKGTFKRRFAIFSLSGLLILLILQSLILRLSFKRLESMQSEIKHLGDGEVVKLSDDVPSEVLPLVKEINHLLTLLEQRLKRSRNALGNLTHALKTPLNLLFQHFDNTSDESEEARVQLERISHLMDRELKRARLAGKGIARQQFNAAREVPELVRVVQQIYAYKQLHIEQQFNETLLLSCDREDMLELMGNLLDNACKWARSKIIINLSDSNTDHVTISIEDDGQGVTEEQIQSLTQRGVRLDESVEGHGLGLSIVHDIVKLYGGSIQFFQSSLGGLRVIIKFDIR
ncbi:MAG: sensor histidine kinase [gamma proteobacterium symbiont of Lucinoma myriamae]|nr:sensor histidine kinase [gamma proteobacterium symbiont of Lucinoma myriamae]MCU7819203.1 sensor histidine kinase [gamma proteobacterium symbiont of Lucinoma myriamae]MCU7833122.1 sensor histidine kinase [gamma proteobacterium symbiont of Lucinoma myriamae]